MDVWECPDHESICMTVDGAVTISKYLADVQEVEDSLAKCPWVERVP